MKPILEYLPRNASESFVVKFFDYPYYPTPWHYHPEFEIVLITESTGKRFVGDQIADFQPGNLALLGENLPHFYRNDSRYYENLPHLRATSIVIHFLRESLGNDFLALPETENIRHLLEKSARGMEISGETRLKVAQKMHEILELQGFSRKIKLLEILHLLAETDEFTFIASPGVVGENEKDNQRMNKILEYVLQNFKEEIHLSHLADLVNMSETSFSRYFKYRTRKTFTQFLNEIRIGHAGKLLVEDNLNIAQICYECGFNNLSNFNRQFRDFHKLSPSEFKKNYLKK